MMNKCCAVVKKNVFEREKRKKSRKVKSRTKDSCVEARDECILDNVLHETAEDDEGEDAASLQAWWLVMEPLLEVQDAVLLGVSRVRPAVPGVLCDYMSVEIQGHVLEQVCRMRE